MSREEAIKIVLNNLGDYDAIISTTGFTSREVYELRNTHEKDFLCVGSMGHCSSIALGIAINKKSRQVFVLDGDGAMLMHMGALIIVGSSEVSNFKHIVFNNECHDSVGAQPTLAKEVSLTAISKACGYKWVVRVAEEQELGKAVSEMRAVQGPAFLEIMVKPGTRKDLGRPKIHPKTNKKDFMKFLDL